MVIHLTTGVWPGRTIKRGNKKLSLIYYAAPPTVVLVRWSGILILKRLSVVAVVTVLRMMRWR
ncbi:hypothetical protein D3C76_1636270 [compost metagenome]